MKHTLGLGLLIMLILGGCYRPTTRQIQLVLTDNDGGETELETLKASLLSEEGRLRDGLKFYESIQVLPEESALQVSYFRRHLADQNIIARLNDLGYTVHKTAGDSFQLEKSLIEMNRP